MYSRSSSISNAWVALTAAAISLDNKSTSKSGSIIQQAIALSPTVFPIVFAAIVGRFFRSLGLYWAERSVKLGIKVKAPTC